MEVLLVSRDMDTLKTGEFFEQQGCSGSHIDSQDLI